MEEEASCSEPDWRWKLEELGFSSKVAARAVESLERGGQKVTMSALLDFLCASPSPGWSHAGPCTPEGSMDSDEDMELDEDEHTGADSDTGVGVEVDGAKYDAQDPRWEDLKELGYSDDIISIALSYNRDSERSVEESVAEVVDWIEAYQLTDVLPPKHETPIDKVVRGVKAVYGHLHPVHEAAIRKSECQDVGEALDLIEAFRQHKELENASAENGVDALNLVEGFEEERRTIPRREVREQRRTRKPRDAVAYPRRIVEEHAFSDAQAGATGFGVPGQAVVPRQLRQDIAGPPYFYFENVAAMAKHEWDQISSALYGIEPEFVDSVHFSACRRPRGYVHNLPVEGRRLIIRQPGMTVQELLPDTCGKHWPVWDPRNKLICIGVRGGHKVVVGITEALKTRGDRIQHDEQFRQETLMVLKKWSLVWTGPNQLSPPTVEEVELMLGFDRGHTRGIVNKIDIWRALENTFQVNTVAYHLSVLKPKFPGGMNVISLFSGIGGAEVALHKVGIRINTLVSIEKEVKVREVILNWWRVTGQQGHLIDDIHDVADFTREKLAEIVRRHGKFDLLIGASPPYNLAGNRDAFHHYQRILHDVRLLSGAH